MSALQESAHSALGRLRQRPPPGIAQIRALGRFGADECFRHGDRAGSVRPAPERTIGMVDMPRSSERRDRHSPRVAGIGEEQGAADVGADRPLVTTRVLPCRAPLACVWLGANRSDLESVQRRNASPRPAGPARLHYRRSVRGGWSLSDIRRTLIVRSAQARAVLSASTWWLWCLRRLARTCSRVRCPSQNLKLSFGGIASSWLSVSSAI